MNSARFYVDMNDNVLKCEYFERIDEFRHELIVLPALELHDLFLRFLKKYHNPVSDEINDTVNMVTFHDIDVNEMDKLINKSRKYKKTIEKNNVLQFKTEVVDNSDIYEKNISNQKKISNTSKVVRKNKFKKVFVRTTASILATLSIYAGAKEILKNIDISDIKMDNDITYDEPLIFEFKNHDNVFPVEELYNNKEEDSILNEDFTNEMTEDNTATDELVFVNDNQSIQIDEEIQEEDLSQDTQVVPSSNDLSFDNLVVSSDDNEIITPDIVFSIDAPDWIDSEKYEIGKAFYFETIEKTARTYGIDPQLALAIGIHERGLHSEHVDTGGGLGLFQIQVEGGWNWVNKPVTAYNFDTGAYETVTITKEMASDVFENIRLGCMLIQNCLIRNDYNVLKAVTEYNYGSKYLDTVINVCSNETGYTIAELNDMNNLEWLKYRNIIGGGDCEYLENVFKYIPNGTILTFQKVNGDEITMQYNNSNIMSKSM